jgi:hypothetical protein
MIPIVLGTLVLLWRFHRHAKALADITSTFSSSFATTFLPLSRKAVRTTMASLQPDMQGLFPGPEEVAITSYAQPTRVDWDPFRPMIKRYYVDEGKTLKEVMAIMERDYGHRAT